MSLFWREERGQDLTEYALLLAFVVVSSAAIYMMNGANISAIWLTTNNHLSAANSAASH